MVSRFIALRIVFLTFLSGSESKRSSPSLLARQLRLRLVAADDSDIPRNLSNIIVSIHAIATFQALHDYLRPRVAGIMSSSSRLSGMLAALAASGLTAGSSSRPLPEEPPAPKPPSSLTAPNTPTPGDGSVVSRRRSLRLSSKVAAREGVPISGATPATPAAAEAGPSSGDPIIPPLSAPATLETNEAPLPEGAPSETVVNDDEPDYEAEFTDEDVDVDAEVIYRLSLFLSHSSSPRHVGY